MPRGNDKLEETTSGSEGHQERRGLPRSYFKPKPVKVGDELDVEITEVSKKGDGLTRVQGYVIFVPNTKQGDKVKIRITQIRPSFALGEVLKP